MTTKQKKQTFKPVPEVGKEYHFWDDGKSSSSRHYICRCERVVKSIKEAKAIKFTLRKYENFLKDSPYTEYEVSLYDVWKDSVKKHNWLIAEDTDAFVEISCPNYDENKLWAVRTKDGGWFTLDIQSSWQGGDVDVTGEKFNNIIEQYEDEGEYGLVEEYKNETYERVDVH